MKHKDILELKKRLKKDHCTISQMCGCYVNSEKQIVTSYRDTFLNLEESDFFKYLEIARKVLSGAMGNNLLELPFRSEEEGEGGRQASLLALKSGRLKDDDLLQAFYQSVIDHFHWEGNYLILLFSDAYDVITRTRDNLKLDESEETYEYMLCAICPVTLSDPGLHYREEERKMRAHHRDWMVAPPLHGFLYPAFTDHSADVNHVLYYTKNPREPHGGLMADVLGCEPLQTTALHRGTIQSLLEEAAGFDEAKAEKLHIELHENLQRMMADETRELEPEEPVLLTRDQLQDLVADGADEEILQRIDTIFDQYFGEDLPQADRVVDQKVLKAAELKKKEYALEKQVENLKLKLEAIQPGADASAEAADDSEDRAGAEPDTAGTGIQLRIQAQRVSAVRREVIDGVPCLIIPLTEDETVAINGEIRAD